MNLLNLNLLNQSCSAYIELRHVDLAFFYDPIFKQHPQTFNIKYYFNFFAFKCRYCADSDDYGAFIYLNF